MNLARGYRGLTEPFSFGGITNVSRYFGGRNNYVENELGKIQSYLMHREAKKPRTFNPVYVYSTRDIMQADLADLRTRSEDNDGVKYLLVVCDSFSRKAWVRPLLSKEALPVWRALKDIFEETGNFRVLYCDRGREFNNRLVQLELAERGAHMRFPNFKCGTVERLNRTLQLLLYRYMTDRKTTRYVDKLQRIVDIYNSRFHRTIGTSPNYADEPENKNFVINKLSYLYDKIALKRKKPKFKVGDHVLMQAWKGAFARGYQKLWVRERQKIKEVHKTGPIPMYTLTSLDGQEDIIGRWYENELQPITTNKYEIESIKRRKLNKRTRVREVLVKLAGYPDRYNTWVPENSIEEDFNGAKTVELDI